jgi:hypothetical protein
MLVNQSFNALAHAYQAVNVQQGIIESRGRFWPISRLNLLYLR